MKIIVSAGGTGGHLYPALALVDYIKEQRKDAEFLFVGTTDRLESQIVPELGYPYKGLYVKGMVGNPLQKMKNGLIFVNSLRHSKKILKEFQPDLVIGFGGYPSASIVLQAAKMNIKTMIHEQNSIIGLTNKILINKVDKIICCYRQAYDQLPKEKTMLLGNPRASVVSHKRLDNIKPMYNIPQSKQIVLIVMGSLGSSSVNAMMVEALKQMQHDHFDVIYVTGKNHYDDMKKELGKLSQSIHLVPYIDDMPSHLANVDLVVTRAGATTLSEITALGTASLIIPSPYVVANHQEYNAKELVDAKAATWILEKDLSTDVFVKTVKTLMNDQQVLKMYRNNALNLGKPNASEDIYKEVVRLVGGK